MFRRPARTRVLVAVVAVATCLFFLVGAAAAPDGAAAATAQAPFVLQAGVGLAEQYGYAPAYTRNIPAFDSHDRAYLRSRTAAEAPTSYVHSLVAGEWLRLDFSAALRAAYPDFAGTVGGGGVRNDRVVFDREDRAYNPLVVRLSDGSTRNVLLVSWDLCRTWKAFELPAGEFATEQWVGHNELDGPPFMAFWRPSFPSAAHRGLRSSLWVTQPRLEGDELVLPPLAMVTNECLGLSRGSGGSSFAVTRGDFTYFVWPESSPVRSRHTPNMIAVYDHRTGLVGEPRQLFATPPDNDTHIKPGICLDSRGYLHAIAGTHGTAVLYRRSLAPGSIDRGWTPAKPVLTTGSVVGDDPSVQVGRQTYNSFLCDSSDTLHLVTRQWRHGVDPYFGGSRYGALVHQSCPAGGPWGEPTLIVVAAEPGYAIYYHKLALDHRDRLFLTCSYSGGDDLWAGKKRAAAMDVLGRSVMRPGKYRRRMLLVSDDGGGAWRFATDADLTAPGEAPAAATPGRQPAPTSGTAPADLPAWGWVSPLPQGDQLTAFDFVDRRRGWAVGTHGTILRTVDGGAHWRTQAARTIANLYGLAAVDALTAWAVGDDGLVLRTADGGRTWRRQGAGTRETLFAVTALSRRAAFAVGSHGAALATTDGGRTWAPRPSSSHEALLSVAFADPQHGFICGSNGHLLRSGDGGRTWHMRPTYTRAALYDLAFADRTHGVAVGGSGTVLVTRDAGLTWSRGRSRLGTRLSAVHFASPTLGWASGAGGQILATHDGGRTWRRQSLPVTGMCGALTGAGGRVWAGGAAGAVCRSDDGGRTWRRLGEGPTRALAAVAVTPSGVWLAGDAGTLVSRSSGGVGWNAVASGTTRDLHALAFAGGEAWAVGAGGAVTHSVDGGAMWTAATPVAATLHAVVAFGGGHAWVAGTGGTLAATADGGDTWTSMPATPEDLLSLDTAGDRGWAGGGAAWGESRAVVARTSDGGLTWEEISLPVWGRVRGLDFVDADTGWAAVEDWGDDGDLPQGAIFATHDGGATWVAQTRTGSVLLDVRMHDALRGVSCGEGGTVLATVDGGATWWPQDAGTDGNLRALAADAGVMWAVGDDGAVLATRP